MAKVKHIGLLKFKPETSEEQINDLFDQLLDLTETIEGIEDYVSGPNTSPENLAQGFTHGFIMTFTDAAARDTYLPHPEHEKFKTNAVPLVESIAVLDFEV
ncbi:MAG: Dabb family protein [Verrucomicrobiota bacterium]